MAAQGRGDDTQKEVSALESETIHPAGFVCIFQEYRCDLRSSAVAFR